VKEAYLRNIDRYRATGKMKLNMIVMNKASSADETATRRRQADEVRGRLAAGESFEALAREHSDGAEEKDGGDWGWIDPKVLRPELEQVIAKMKTGEISDVVETKDGFYILRVEGRMNEAPSGFRDVQPQVERETRMKESERLYNAWIENLKSDCYVKALDAPGIPSQPSP
jgi:parvulin-like peptidyl-prolyl isomerase